MSGIGGIFKKGKQLVETVTRKLSPTRIRKGSQSAQGETSEPTQPPSSAPESRGNEAKVDFGGTLTSLMHNIETVPQQDTAQKLGELFQNLFEASRYPNENNSIMNGIFSENGHEIRRLLTFFADKRIERDRNPLEIYLQNDYQENALVKKDDIIKLSRILENLSPDAVKIFKEESSIGEHFDNFKKTLEDIKKYTLEKEIKKEYNEEERQITGSYEVLIKSLEKINPENLQTYTDVAHNYANLICAIKDMKPEEDYKEILKVAHKQIGIDKIKDIFQNKNAQSTFKNKLKNKYSTKPEIAQQIKRDIEELLGITISFQSPQLSARPSSPPKKETHYSVVAKSVMQSVNSFDNFINNNIETFKQYRGLERYDIKYILSDEKHIERRLLNVIHSKFIRVAENGSLIFDGKESSINDIYQKAKELPDDKKQEIKHIHGILQNLQDTPLKLFKNHYDSHHTTSDTKFEKIKEVFGKIFEVIYPNDDASQPPKKHDPNASTSGTSNDTPTSPPKREPSNASSILPPQEIMKARMALQINKDSSLDDILKIKNSSFEEALKKRLDDYENPTKQNKSDEIGGIQCRHKIHQKIKKGESVTEVETQLNSNIYHTESKYYKTEDNFRILLEHDPRILKQAIDKINNVLKQAGIKGEITSQSSSEDIDTLCYRVSEDIWNQKPETNELFELLKELAQSKATQASGASSSRTSQPPRRSPPQPKGASSNEPLYSPPRRSPPQPMGASSQKPLYSPPRRSPPQPKGASSSGTNHPPQSEIPEYTIIENKARKTLGIDKNASLQDLMNAKKRKSKFFNKDNIQQAFDTLLIDHQKLFEARTVINKALKDLGRSEILTKDTSKYQINIIKNTIQNSHSTEEIKESFKILVDEMPPKSELGAQYLKKQAEEDQKVKEASYRPDDDLKTLELPNNTDWEKVKKRYRKLSTDLHPDKVQNKLIREKGISVEEAQNSPEMETAQKDLQTINKAYEALNNHFNPQQK